MDDIQMFEEGAVSTSTDALPSCLICGGPGHGIHYGVNTCDACKGFFHRSMRIHAVYKCAKDSTCKVVYGKGKMCKLCRYHKCLEVGMSERAIKLGRHSTKRRYESLMTQERDKRTKLSSPIPPKQTETPSKPLTTHQPDKQDTVTRLDQPDTSSDVSQTSNIPSGQRNDISPLHGYPSPISEGGYCSGPTFLGNEKSVTNNYSFPNESLRPDSLDSGRPQTPISPPQSNWTPVDITPSRGQCNSCLSPEKARALESYENMDIILKTLLNAEHEYIKMPDDNCRSERLKEAEKHFEKCKERTEMFGRLPIGTEDENNRLYQQTGLYEGECLSFLNDIVESSEVSVKVMVRFMKAVPGFSLFSMKDKINLLKDGCSAFHFLSLYEDVHGELGVTYLAPGLYFCPFDATRYGHLSDISTAFIELIKFSVLMQNQNITDEERVLLRALTIIKPGCVKLDNAPLAHEIHRRLREMMITCLAKRHKNPQFPFATIMSLVTQVRATKVAFDSWMANLNSGKYLSEQNPLIKEMICVKEPGSNKDSHKFCS